jgi:3-deoxy-D-manno-octulosonic-acid transferase
MTNAGQNVYCRMRLLYSIGIYLYQSVLVMLRWFKHTKAKAFLDGRKDLWGKLDHFSAEGKKVIWFHCASLGEFEQARPIIEWYAAHRTHYYLLLTFFSPSGYAIRKDFSGVDAVLYMPLDTPANAAKFISKVKPSIMIFTKYDLWWNHIHEALAMGCKGYLIAARFRKSHWFLQFPFTAFQRNLKAFEHLFLQYEEEGAILSSLGFQNYSFAGDTRYDRVMALRTQVQLNPLPTFIKRDKPIFVAGSVWPEDMAVLIPFIQKHHHHWRFLIAPHEIHTEQLNEWSLKLGLNCQRYTAKKENEEMDGAVCFLDTIGHLAKAYSLAELAYIGGAFGKGLHNILEAATFGVPVFFGPKHDKFPEASLWIQHQMGHSIHTTQTLEEKAELLMKHAEARQEIKTRIMKFIENQSGASERICRSLPQ